jgi:hypothetical protein
VNPDLVRRMHIWLEERRPEMTADLADFVTIETPSTDK